MAQAVVNARNIYSGSSLAALYDPLTMPPELLKAHQSLDRAVMKLYKFNINTKEKSTSEPDIVSSLLGRYRELSGG